MPSGNSPADHKRQGLWVPAFAGTTTIGRKAVTQTTQLPLLSHSTLPGADPPVASTATQVTSSGSVLNRGRHAVGFQLGPHMRDVVAEHDDIVGAAVAIAPGPKHPKRSSCQDRRCEASPG